MLSFRGGFPFLLGPLERRSTVFARVLILAFIKPDKIHRSIGSQSPPFDSNHILQVLAQHEQADPFLAMVMDLGSKLKAKETELEVERIADKKTEGKAAEEVGEGATYEELLLPFSKAEEAAASNAAEEAAVGAAERAEKEKTSEELLLPFSKAEEAAASNAAEEAAVGAAEKAAEKAEKEESWNLEMLLPFPKAKKAASPKAAGYATVGAAEKEEVKFLKSRF